MAPQKTPARLKRIIEIVRADELAGEALAVLCGSLIRLGGNFPLDPFDQLFAEAASEARPGASFFSGVLAQMQRDTDFVEWLAERQGDRAESDIADQIRKFDQHRLLDRLDEVAGEGKYKDLVGKAVEKLKEKVADSTGGAQGESKADRRGNQLGETGKDSAAEKPKAPTTIQIKGPDGTSVRVDSNGNEESKGGAPDEPEEKGPPTVYGGENENATYLYAISLDRIECIEVTDFTAAGILSFGIVAATGVDDEIGFISRGVARFKNGVRTPFLAPSDGVHIDVSDGDVLSDRPEAVKPASENSLKLKQSETFLVNRYVFRGITQLGQAPILSDYAPFDLEDFLRANIQFTLFEDDSDVKKAIDRILALLQQLTALARQLFAATGGAGAVVTATLETFDSNQVFVRLNTLLQGLISSSDVISFHDFRISAPQIKSAFETAANIKSYPPNSNPPSFEYVTDRAEQIAQLNGDGARYRAILRYERHKMN